MKLETFRGNVILKVHLTAHITPLIGSITLGPSQNKKDHAMRLIFNGVRGLKLAFNARRNFHNLMPTSGWKKLALLQ
ncbi:unnamed protein product [Brassica oleracea var. botrytis]|uniref:(rape) hypothetical protein n=1 Tax=Brassica napus TaxID=3708 RepID=A0A816RFJ7_BRANA|nr:unnamed protein product [Brassica napus]